MRSPVSEKRVLIVGGGTGVGRATALAFAEAGATVAIAGRREEKLREVAKTFTGNPAIQLRRCDTSDRDDARALVEWATAEMGGVDILVQSAGINIRRRMMSDIDPDDWDRVLRVNATGAFNTIHAVLPQMRERGRGDIINISSVAGKRAVLLGGVAYNASKFAMSALGTSVGLEAGKDGVRVTNIYPGEINTPILDERPNPVSDEHRARILQPEDVAAAVLLAASLPPEAHIPELVIKPTIQEFA